MVQDIRRKDDSVFPVAVFRGRDTMQFFGIDEIEAFGPDRKRIHIDLQLKFTGGKIEDFNLVMPMVLDKGAFSGRICPVNCAGKGLRAVQTDFF